MATIKDVAELAGVSPSTASRAMHNNPTISPKTQKRVHEAMAKLNYAPDFNAQSLANKRSNAIGVILPVDHQDIFANPFFMEIIRGVSEVCYEAKLMVNLATGTSQEELLNSINTMVTQGMIRRFILLYSEKNDPVIERLIALKVHFVIVGKPYRHVNETPYVDNDNILAGADATRFLVAHGHQEICFVYSDLGKMVQNDRLMGYRQIIEAHGYSTRKLKIAFAKYVDDFEIIKRYVNDYPNVTAFVAVDDMLGLRLQQVLNAVHSKEDRPSVIGFNNSIFAEASHPTLTSVEIFPRRLGAEAARIVIDLKHADSLAAKIIVPHRIIERNSVQTLA